MILEIKAIESINLLSIALRIVLLGIFILLFAFLYTSKVLNNRNHKIIWFWLISMTASMIVKTLGDFFEPSMFHELIFVVSSKILLVAALCAIVMTIYGLLPKKEIS